MDVAVLLPTLITYSVLHTRGRHDGGRQSRPAVGVRPAVKAPSSETSEGEKITRARVGGTPKFRR
jgi:hypothetical protein